MTQRQQLAELKYQLCKTLSEAGDEEGSILTARVFNTVIDLLDGLEGRELVIAKEIL